MIKKKWLVSWQSDLPIEICIPWAVHKGFTGGILLFLGNQFPCPQVKYKAITSIS